MSAARQGLRHELGLRLRLTQGLCNSLSILRMSGMELCTALATESERNPFLEVRLPEAGIVAEPAPSEEAPEQLTWRAHLLEQSRRAGWGARVISAVETLIRMLDDEGYLKGSAADLRAMAPLQGFSQEEIRDARAKLAQLNPPGMGAANLRERLLMQLDELGPDPASESARKLVANHLEDLASGNLEGIALPLLDEAIELVSALSPVPSDPSASGFAPQSADIVVRKRGTLWRAEAGPGLDIGVEVGASPRESGLDWEPSALGRAEGLWHAAGNMAQSVSYRRGRLLEIGQVIVDFQHEYLERGLGGLQPLRMADLADEIGVSAATISLAVRGKTIASPRGFHELKYLIPRSFSKSGTTRELMKQALSQAIAGENPWAPMSDRELAESMSSMGAPSRRAVAKLRAELGAPSSRARRRRERPDK